MGQTRTSDTQHAYETPVSQWTKDDWLVAHLGYCKKCMAGPWDAHFVAPGTGWGQFGVEPCPHGTLWNKERILQVKHWFTLEQSIWTAVLLFACTFSTFIFWPLAVILALAFAFWAYQLITFRWSMDALIERFSTTSLVELDGMWMPRHKRTQPWEKKIF